MGVEGLVISPGLISLYHLENNSVSNWTHRHAYTEIERVVRYIFVGTLHRHNDFYTVQTVYYSPLH